MNVSLLTMSYKCVYKLNKNCKKLNVESKKYKKVSLFYPTSAIGGSLNLGRYSSLGLQIK